MSYREKKNTMYSNAIHGWRSSRMQMFKLFSINVRKGICDNLVEPFLLPSGEKYLTSLQEPDLLEDVPTHIRRRMSFQHDEALAHYGREVRNDPNVSFQGRWIRRGDPIVWPPRSPGLSWGWGYSLRSQNIRVEKIWFCNSNAKVQMTILTWKVVMPPLELQISLT